MVPHLKNCKLISNLVAQLTELLFYVISSLVTLKEFAEPSFINAAVSLDNSLFRARLLKVSAKRTNVPGFSARGRGRGRGGFRGGGVGGPGGFAPYYGHSPMYGYRGRGRGRGGFYAPY
ncbi:hypothetical protein G6F56_006314 [Rhizopus delemar]|nr:hypothetical protein G6F56_006314 [Rhizopus delemar]